MADINVEDHLNLVHYVLRRLSSRTFEFYEYDDLFQTGALALVNAAKHYNPEMKTAFSTFAVKAIWNGINRIFLEGSRQKRTAKVLSLDAVINPEKAPNNDSVKSDLYEFIVDARANSAYRLALYRITLEAELKGNLFSAREKELIETALEYYTLNQTILADHLDISKVYVGQLIRKINKKLKKTQQIKG